MIVFQVPEMLPPGAVQITAVLEVPVTAAVKPVAPEVERLAAEGVMATEMVGSGGSITVNVALATAVPSAEVAVTVYVPGVFDAV